MAKPRVFISSTYYDLKHIRASLEGFIESMGFEPILSEKGHISYSHDQPLDESCYREIGGADMFVMIIGGRYGSEKSSGNSSDNKEFMTKYDSVTKEEMKNAIERDIPIYIFIEKPVFADYENYRKNRDIKFEYAHVDSINTLELINDIISLKRNNAVQQFERYNEIEDWLRQQWAGAFRDFLQRDSSQKQLASLEHQVSELKILNQNLRSYMEKIIRAIDPGKSDKIIEEADLELKSAKIQEAMNNSTLCTIMSFAGLKFDELENVIEESNSFEECIAQINNSATTRIDKTGHYARLGISFRRVEESFDEIRKLMGLPIFERFDPANQSFHAGPIVMSM